MENIGNFSKHNHAIFSFFRLREVLGSFVFFKRNEVNQDIAYALLDCCMELTFYLPGKYHGNTAFIKSFLKKLVFLFKWIASIIFGVIFQAALNQTEEADMLV